MQELEATRNGSTEASNLRSKGVKEKNPKPIRQESYPLETVFEKNSFSFIDDILQWGGHRGRKGFPPSSLFAALLFMMLKGIESILALTIILKNNPQWLVVLGLKRNDKVVEKYMVPSRRTFGRLASRMGVEKSLEIFITMVVMLMKEGIIKA